jgi:hypothetical protein
VAVALAAMARAPDDTARRLAFYETFAAAELHLWLAAEARSDDGGERIEPRVFPLSSGPAVLAFDTEAALAAFAGAGAPYAALPGRVLAPMLAAQGLGLMVQTDDGGAELISAAALDWLVRTLAAPAPAAGQGVALGYDAPALPPAVAARLVPALERRLAEVPGLTAAVLAGVRWQGGGSGTVLALAGVPEAAQAPLARAVAEALAFAGLEAAALDVIFPAPRALAPIAAVGLPLALPAPSAPEAPAAPIAPGMDPARPPKLR